MNTLTKPIAYADVRGSQQPGYECGGCGCRSRSHFYVCDNGDIYNVDTKGFIWYCAAASTDWTKIYKCRNFIPWQPYLSRLDHVGRDEQGRAGNFRESKRIPCGRPMSGNFCGFQTDTDACVLFKNGQKVYEGKYVSDCDGALGFGNQLGLDFYGYSTGYTYNYLTESGCNNNEPVGNDDPLYRNTQGQYDENWNFTSGNQFVRGDVTPLFSAIREGSQTAIAKDTHGWQISTGTTDCCGNSYITGETGFHLGTNETGTTVWFTRERVGTKWWRFAGRVADVDSLPDLINLKNWQVVGENGTPKTPGTLQDLDVIAITTGTDWESLWTAPCYYLKDFTWHEAGTYQELIMKKGIAVVFHDSCQSITSCSDMPDCWLGNAQSIQSCGDILLVNANQTGVDRLVLFGSTVLYNGGCVFPGSSSLLNDSIICNLSLRYFDINELPDINIECFDKDGLGLITLTHVDGTKTQLIVYGTTRGWAITETLTIGVSENEWTGLTGQSGQNCWYCVLGREIDGGVERLILYKGQIVEKYTYQYSWYTDFPSLSTGLTGTCKLSYPCPDSQGRTLYSLWDESGSQVISCGDISWAIPNEVYYFNKYDDNGRPIAPHTVITRTTTGSVSQVDYYGCTKTELGTNTYETQLTYLECFWIRGGLFYKDINIRVLLTQYNGGTYVLTANGNAETLRTDEYNCSGTNNCNSYSQVIYIPKGIYLGIQGGEGLQGGEVYTRTKPAFVGTMDYIASVKPDENGQLPQGTNNYNYNIGFFYQDSFGQYQREERSMSLSLCYDMQSTYTQCSSGSDMDYVEFQSAIALPTINIGTSDFYYNGTCQYSLYGANISNGRRTTVSIGTGSTYGSQPGFCLWDGSRQTVSLNNIVNWHRNETYGNTIQETHYFLEVEYCWFTDPSSGNYGCNKSSCVKKFVTHVLTLEWSTNPAYPTVKCNLVSYNYSKQEINIDPCSVTDTSEDGSGPCGYGSTDYPSYCCNPDVYKIYQNTVFYKACTGGKRFHNHCGYIIEDFDDGHWTAEYKGKVYTSPASSTGNAQIIMCCQSAYAILIQENIGNTVNLYYFAEGNLIWNTTYQIDTEADEKDSVRSLQCCASQTVDEDGMPFYRYTLLRINALNEELVDYNGEWFGGTAAKPMTCEAYPPGDPQLVIDAMAHAAEYTITLTDGTIAMPTHCTADWIQEFGTGLCIPACWYDEYTTSDGIKFAGLFQKGIDHGGLDTGWRIINNPIYDNINLAKKRVYETGSGRQSILTCNGSVIGSNKNYEGIFCCGDYLLAAYVDDEYKSGWSNIVDTGGADVDIIESKHVPFPGYGDSQRPNAENKAAWKYFNAVHSDYKVDVFYHGGKVGTYDVNDFNSPIHYDHLDMQYPWTMFAIGVSNAHSPNVGNHPDCMEGNPVCLPMSAVNASGSVVVPYNDSLTVLRGSESKIQSFGVKC